MHACTHTHIHTHTHAYGEVGKRRRSYCRQTFCRLSLRSRCTRKGTYVACHLGRIVMTFSLISGHNVASTSTSHTLLLLWNFPNLFNRASAQFSNQLWTQCYNSAVTIAVLSNLKTFLFYVHSVTSWLINELILTILSVIKYKSILNQLLFIRGFNYKTFYVVKLCQAAIS
jgi:hypothetical protein